MNNASIAALSAAVMLGWCDSALAADFEVPFDLPTGSVLHVDVVKKSSVRLGDETDTVDMNFRYRQEIVAIPEGYRVTQTMVDSRLPPQAVTVTNLLSSAPKIVFEASENLEPVRILDVDELMAGVTQGVTEAMKGKAPPEAIAAGAATVKRLYGSMTPELAAKSILKEQTFLVGPQLMALDVNKPLGGKSQVPSPFGGPGTVTRTLLYELKTIDRVKGIAVIESLDELDPETLKAAIMPLYGQIAPTAPKLTAEQASAFRIEQKLTCRYEVDLKTGLTAKADCTASRSTIGGGGRAVGQVEQTTITQRLERP